MAIRRLGVLILVVLTGSAPIVAHHSAAAFETTKAVTMKGTVTEWRWANPHCILKYDVVEASGARTSWSVETANPTTMTQRGWARLSFKTGDEVTLTLLPSRNGEPVGLLLRATLPDGQQLITSPPGQPVPNQ